MDLTEPTEKKTTSRSQNNASKHNERKSHASQKKGGERKSTTAIGTGAGTVQEELSLYPCFFCLLRSGATDALGFSCILPHSRSATNYQPKGGVAQKKDIDEGVVHGWY